MATMQNDCSVSSRKNSWLWIVLAATLGASIWVSVNEENAPEAVIIPGKQFEEVNLVKSRAKPINNTTINDENEVSSAIEFRRPMITDEPRQLFAGEVQDETVNIEAQSELPQQAPPLPFTYAGKLVEDGKYTIFLLSGGRSFAVNTGDVIEEVWRLKAFHPPRIVFSYLPLKMEAVMDIGESIE